MSRLDIFDTIIAVFCFLCSSFAFAEWQVDVSAGWFLFLFICSIMFVVEAKTCKN